MKSFNNPWGTKSSPWFNRDYQRWMAPSPRHYTPRKSFKPDVVYNYDRIESNYEKDGQMILEWEFEAGKEGSYSKSRWEDLYGEDTCAIRLSYALNHAGYKIPEHTTFNKRSTWTSNLDPTHEYILSADEMGSYLKRLLGTPTFTSNGIIEDDDHLEKFIDKFDQYTEYGGLIYIDSLRPTGYEASGHVDLVIEESGFWGGTYPYLFGNEKYLDDHLDWNNNDPSWSNADARLQVFVWLLKGNKV